MIYLKKFETTAAYNAARENLILPNVSLITENNKVAYNPLNPTPPTPSHDYVEIGGVKWATMNIGANSITDYGLYFEWGNPQGYSADQIGCEEGKKCFDRYYADYKWTEDGGSTFTKYNDEDGLTTLQSADDAVAAAWGGNWRMPTTAEFQALGAAVNTALTQVDGVYGLQCTDKTDSSKVLFFPACGDVYDGVNHLVGYDGGIYWSSSLDSDSVESAYALNFYASGINWNLGYSRCHGFSVRGVLGN